MLTVCINMLCKTDIFKMEEKFEEIEIEPKQLLFVNSASFFFCFDVS